MQPSDKKKPLPHLLRFGAAVLLAMPSSGALTTESTELGEPAAAAMKLPPVAIGRGDVVAAYDADPIERIYWETIDVVVPEVQAASSDDTPGGPFEDNPVAINDSDLDDIRGGFEFADANLRISFGIERAVFVNGQLVASSVLNFKDLQWTSGSGKAVEQVPTGANSAIGLIQNGAGNTVAARLGANLAGTVIQNTLNDQNIQNVTTINASLNSGQLMRSIAVQSAVHDAIVNSLRR